MKRQLVAFALFAAASSTCGRSADYELNGEKFTRTQAQVGLWWKTPETITVYDKNGRVSEIFEDINENGIVGDVKDETYTQVLPSGKRIIIDKNYVIDENGLRYVYQGPHYFASQAEQDVVQAGRQKLASVTPRYQMFRNYALKSAAKSVGR